MIQLLRSVLPIILIFAVNSGEASEVIRVSPSNRELGAAIAAADSGDTIVVEGGQHDGLLKIDKKLILLGRNSPVIDGNNHGTVVEIAAAGVHLEGFVIRNSGISLSQENAGISVNAPYTVIKNNRIENILFGVYVRNAHHTVIRDNEIIGKAELDIPRRGDLVRVWYSDSVRIENNRIENGRDVIIWFSNGAALNNNRITNARYGLHFMYSNDCHIENNISTGNSVGAYLMYSRRLTMRHNTIAYNRGPSGFGIGLKDFDDGIIEENLIVDNRVGIFVDNSPREVESSMRYEGNVLAYNDVGVSLLSFIKRSRLIENSFIENYEQVGVSGSGQLAGNDWINNYWSDYAGYDRNKDGLGDIPYKSEKLFENLMDQHPKLKLFIYSPAIQALEFAAKTFPVVKPAPKLEDPQPRMAPHIPVGLASVSLSTQWGLLVTAISLFIFGGIITFGFSKKLKARDASTSPLSEKSDPASSGSTGGRDLSFDEKAETMIEARNLTKKFGNLTAVNDVSIAVRKGEAVALWGSNGAGKTTVLRCLLGVLPFEGQIRISNFDAAKDGKQARKLIGFVPQEISFHDNLSVRETLEFYARLKKTTPNTIEDWINRLGLQPHLEKTVKELSGGMKQKLALAIALLANPPILFLDEPTANLDMHSRDDFLDLLMVLKKEGKTIVFSSHRLEEVFSFADRVLILDQGSLIADCPPAEVYEKLGKHTYLLLYVPEDKKGSAADILAKHGFAVSPNGAGIKVKVDSHLKGQPISILAGEGISVNDFEYEVEK